VATLVLVWSRGRLCGCVLLTWRVFSFVPVVAAFCPIWGCVLVLLRRLRLELVCLAIFVFLRGGLLRRYRLVSSWTLKLVLVMGLARIVEDTRICLFGYRCLFL